MTLESNLLRLFITGTDTDVGKSVVAFLILKTILTQGDTPIYLKPLQTGCAGAHDSKADAVVIAKHLDYHGDVTPKYHTLYCLPQPKAPWFAARDAKQKIIKSQLIEKINIFKNQAHPLVIEGAGGLMVPISADFLMIDLMAHLNLPVVLVARDGLGTINHTLLSLAALKRQGISKIIVLLTATSPKPTSTQMIMENKLAIELFGQVAVAGHIGWINDFKAIPDNTMALIQKILAEI
jgi:dethiobiotin synthetase